MRIGSKYLENVLGLMAKLAGGFLEITDSVAEDHVCYFCKKRIRGKMFTLKDREKDPNGYETESKYFSDQFCFKDITEYKNKIKLIN